MLVERTARRAAMLVAGVLIWILHAFVRLALWPLSMLEYVYYSAAAGVVMAGLTYLCAYYLLIVYHGHRFAAAARMTILWLVIYVVAEYARNYYLTRSFRYPTEDLPRLALEVLFIPVGTLLCGAVTHAISRRVDKSSRYPVWR